MYDKADWPIQLEVGILKGITGSPWCNISPTVYEPTFYIPVHVIHLRGYNLHRTKDKGHICKGNNNAPGTPSNPFNPNLLIKLQKTQNPQSFSSCQFLEEITLRTLSKAVCSSRSKEHSQKQYALVD